jgi:hypothetical protein
MTHLFFPPRAAYFVGFRRKIQKNIMKALAVFSRSA